MMVMVMVIVMIHHGDTLHHDQADTAPLLGTYTYNIIYFVWMLKVWKDLQNQNGWELTLSLSMTRPSCLTSYRDGATGQMDETRRCLHQVTRDTLHVTPVWVTTVPSVPARLLIDIRHPQTCDTGRGVSDRHEPGLSNTENKFD